MESTCDILGTLLPSLPLLHPIPLYSHTLSLSLLANSFGRFVVHQVRYAPMRTALLTEMIARIMKCLILEQFREKMQERKIPCEEPYKETVASFLNLVISRDSLSPQSGHVFWGEHLQQKIIQKFSVDYGTLSIRGEDPNREEIFGSGMLPLPFTLFLNLFFNFYFLF